MRAGQHIILSDVCSALEVNKLEERAQCNLDEVTKMRLFYGSQAKGQKDKQNLY